MSAMNKPTVRINGIEVEGIADFRATITLMPDGRHRHEIDVTTTPEADDAYIDRIADRAVEKMAEAMSAAIERERDAINREALGEDG